MLWKYSFRHSRWANMENWQSISPNEVIKRMKARAAWRQTESGSLECYVACDPKRSLRPRNVEIRTSWAMKRKRNEMRIMLRGRPLGQDSELKIQRQRLGRSRKIQRQLKTRDWQPESTKKCLTRWWLLLQTVWATSWVPTMRGSRRWGWWRDSAGPAQPRWWTWLDDEDNHQNGRAVHGEVSAEADEPGRIDTTRMGWGSQLLPWKR